MLDLREMLKPGPFWAEVSPLALDRDLVWRRAEEWSARPMLAAALRAGGTLFAALRELANRAVPPLGSSEKTRSVLATLGSLPPRLDKTPRWIRMARRTLLTQTGRLARVFVQAGQRKLFY
jgi:hypothetical protein